MTRLLVGPVLRHVGSTDATVWIETDGPCEVAVLDSRERTWQVGGHHFALVHVQGLTPDASTEYGVQLDGQRAWPPLDSSRPPSRIRTLPDDATDVRLAFGSCRYGRAATKLSDKHFDADGLACYARELHDLEAWDEELCSDRHGRGLNHFGEWLRRAADLEHWASFHLGFERLAELPGKVAGASDAPASVCVLSGDVHHAYVAEAHYALPLNARVFQLTCSPLHNTTTSPGS